MENNQENTSGESNQNVLTNNPSDQRPDEETQNETGFAGTTNSISENHQETDQYQTAIEDTMIGYDGDESQMDMDQGNGDINTENTRGVDDND